MASTIPWPWVLDYIKRWSQHWFTSIRHSLLPDFWYDEIIYLKILNTKTSSPRQPVPLNCDRKEALLFVTGFLPGHFVTSVWKESTRHSEIRVTGWTSLSSICAFKILVQGGRYSCGYFSVRREIEAIHRNVFISRWIESYTWLFFLYLSVQSLSNSYT